MRPNWLTLSLAIATLVPVEAVVPDSGPWKRRRDSPPFPTEGLQPNNFRNRCPAPSPVTITETFNVTIHDYRTVTKYKDCVDGPPEGGYYADFHHGGVKYCSTVTKNITITTATTTTQFNTTTTTEEEPTTTTTTTTTTKPGTTLFNTTTTTTTEPGTTEFNTTTTTTTTTKLSESSTTTTTTTTKPTTTTTTTTSLSTTTKTSPTTTSTTTTTTKPTTTTTTSLSTTTKPTTTTTTTTRDRTVPTTVPTTTTTTSRSTTTTTSFTTIVTVSVSTLTLPASTTTLTEAGRTVLITLPPVISVSVTTITLPGVVTTLPGSVTTLPGSVTTLSGSTVTLPGSVVTLPASTVTLPGSVTVSTITDVQQLPPSTIIAAGQTIVIPAGVSFITVPVTVTNQVTLPSGTVTLPGATVTETAQVSLVVCTKRVRNPTYTAPAPLPTDYTWGCPPGFLCKPPKEGCDIEAGLPDPGYYCSPDQCEKVPPLKPAQRWGTPVISDLVEKYKPQDDLFNLNPRNFKLDYDIFVANLSVVVKPLQSGDATSTHLPTVTKRSHGDGLSKRALTAPPACFDDCNACAQEGESTGKSPALCSPDSVFNAALGDCKTCVQRKSGGSLQSFQDSVAPDLQQWVDFCTGSKVGPGGSGNGGNAQSEVQGGASSAGSVVNAAPALTATSAASSAPAPASSTLEAPPASSTTAATSEPAVAASSTAASTDSGSGNSPTTEAPAGASSSASSGGAGGAGAGGANGDTGAGSESTGLTASGTEAGAGSGNATDTGGPALFTGGSNTLGVPATSALLGLFATMIVFILFT